MKRNSPTFVDTHFIVALTNERDTHHSAALALADELEGQPLLTTTAVLLEIGNALARGGKRRAIQVLDELLASEELTVVQLSGALFDRAYGLYRKHRDKDWGLVDCVSFVVMEEEGIHNALTNDRHFEQAGFQPLLRVSAN
ncbi:MAG: PIN domain nuclease [Pedosphaera sp. Tous-C6FEB]|nr:MAG: PIN domain nuclease [Pedosphaera sp. Tous-C6FEB]